MNKGEWGKVRAFFDIRTQEGFIIKGFKIIEGINGLFVSMPSQKGKEDEYFDTVWVERELREELNQVSLDAYNMENSDTLSPNESNLTNEAITTNKQREEETSEEKAMSTESKSADSVQPFSEDDIPF